MVANTIFDLMPVPGGGAGGIGMLACACAAQRSDESLGLGAAVQHADCRFICCWRRYTFVVVVYLMC